MLCPRALLSAPRHSLVRQFYGVGTQLPAESLTCLGGQLPGPVAWRPSPQQQHQQGRCFASFKRSKKPKLNVTTVLNFGGAQRAPAPAGRKEKDSVVRLRDRAILRDHPFIHIKDVEAGTLSEPLQTHDVLEGMDLKTETLVCIKLPTAKPTAHDADTAPQAGDEASEPTRQQQQKGPQYPICIVSNRAAYEKRLEEELKARRRKELGTKELEFNWAIDTHDMDHKLRKLHELVTKGYAVEITLLHKKRAKKRATREEAKDTLQRIRDALAEIPGAKESREAEGAVGQNLTLFIEAPVKRGSKAAPGAEEKAGAGQA